MERLHGKWCLGSGRGGEGRDQHERRPVFLEHELEVGRIGPYALRARSLCCPSFQVFLLSREQKQAEVREAGAPDSRRAAAPLSVYRNKTQPAATWPHRQLGFGSRFDSKALGGAAVWKSGQASLRNCGAVSQSTSGEASSCSMQKERHVQRGPVFGELFGNDAGSWKAVAVIAEIMVAR